MKVVTSYLIWTKNRHFEYFVVYIHTKSINFLPLWEQTITRTDTDTVKHNVNFVRNSSLKSLKLKLKIHKKCVIVHIWRKNTHFVKTWKQNGMLVLPFQFAYLKLSQMCYSQWMWTIMPTELMRRINQLDYFTATAPAARQSYDCNVTINYHAK